MWNETQSGGIILFPRGAVAFWRIFQTCNFNIRLGLIEYCRMGVVHQAAGKSLCCVRVKHEVSMHRVCRSNCVTDNKRSLFINLLLVSMFSLIEVGVTLSPELR